VKRMTSFASAAVVLATAVTLAGPANASLAARTSPGARLPVITVAMTGKTIRVGGMLRSGGVRIVSTVTREPQGQPAFIRLDPGVTLAHFFRLLRSGAASDPNNLNGVASIVVDAQASRGTSAVQANLRPGQYVALDTIGNNPATWPVTTFVIAAASSPAKLPAPQAAVRAIEFGFRGPGTLHDGELVRFGNRGFLVHMIIAIGAKSRAGANEIAKLLKEGKDGQAQKLAAGFTTFAGPLSHGAFQQLVVSVHPGYWVLACFMNTQDGREHTVLGMERVIRITA